MELGKSLHLQLLKSLARECHFLKWETEVSVTCEQVTITWSSFSYPMFCEYWTKVAISTCWQPVRYNFHLSLVQLSCNSYQNTFLLSLQPGCAHDKNSNKKLKQIVDCYHRLLLDQIGITFSTRGYENIQPFLC